ncbi:MAG: SDR family oxidoreductase [Anaerolineae bacterium]|nr:SDR family oxidoreductase [Anaerolineae bacterium]
MDFNNKLALVSGGSSGIGLAVAKLLAQKGASVFILARTVEKLQAALAEIETARCTPQQVFGSIVADVSNEAEVTDAIQQFISAHGVPDILCNAAGVAHPGEFDRLDSRIFRWMMEVNYLGTVYVTRAVAAGMISRKSGMIINFSSVLGFLAFYGYSAYCASKYAVRGFSDALRVEMKRYGVQVSVVFPSDVETPQLEYEHQHQTEVIKAFYQVLAQLFGAKTITPQAVAEEVLEKAARGRYVILPGSDAKLSFFLVGALGNLIYPLIDRLMRMAYKKLNQ